MEKNFKLFLQDQERLENPRNSEEFFEKSGFSFRQQGIRDSSGSPDAFVERALCKY